ncbi:MAG: glycosyltransferase [Clostridia bacterium]|jgi:glycosyltransferase involved in cell wall biosynthesis|nr:glycosyltransferase [Clostridia bacterium]MDH7572248.1 glycosyltransferase [Clostridia bacterium]
MGQNYPAGKPPTVSVIIPTYNRAHLVGRAIKSVLNQTYQDFEIIVVDDASRDNTEEVVRSFNDPRIRYLRHEHNLGGSAARNTGIRAARGEFIAFLDSDDEWLPEKLAYQLAVFSEDHDCGAVYTELVWVSDDGPARRVGTRAPEGNILKQLLGSNVVGTTSSVVIRRECLERVGLFDETLPSCQDWDLWIRIARLYRFRKVSIPLVRYYWHRAQISTDEAAVVRGHAAILAKYGREIRLLGRKRIEGSHYFVLGRQLCHLGNFRLGRYYLFRAAVSSPWRAHHTVYALAALLGPQWFWRLRACKRALGCALGLVSRLRRREAPGLP